MSTTRATVNYKSHNLAIGEPVLLALEGFRRRQIDPDADTTGVANHALVGFVSKTIARWSAKGEPYYRVVFPVPLGDLDLPRNQIIAGVKPPQSEIGHVTFNSAVYSASKRTPSGLPWGSAGYVIGFRRFHRRGKWLVRVQWPTTDVPDKWPKSDHQPSDLTLAPNVPIDAERMAFLPGAVYDDLSDFGGDE